MGLFLCEPAEEAELGRRAARHAAHASGASKRGRHRPGNHGLSEWFTAACASKAELIAVARSFTKPKSATLMWSPRLRRVAG